MPSRNGFKNIYKIIKNEIENNLYATGSILPTESQVAERFDVSRLGADDQTANRSLSVFFVAVFVSRLIAATFVTRQIHQ